MTNTSISLITWRLPGHPDDVIPGRITEDMANFIWCPVFSWALQREAEHLGLRAHDVLTLPGVLSASPLGSNLDPECES